MSQNFTIDDSDSTLAYTSGWRVASSDDSTLDNYSQDTYHVTQTPGSNVSLSFSGAAIYLFGSKGPDRGNFSVGYDNLVQLLTSRADTLSYQQLLFSARLPPGNHSLTVTYTDDSNHWFDLDFVTVSGTANGTFAASAVASTISPQPLISSTTESSPLASNSGDVTPPYSSKDMKGTIVVLSFAVIAAAFILMLLILAVGYHIRRLIRRRHGNSPSTNDESKNEDPQSLRSSGSASLEPQSITPPVSSSRQSSSTYLGSSTQQSSSTHLGSDPQPQLPIAAIGNSPDCADVKMRQWKRGSPAPAFPAARPWSPFLALMNRMFGAVKGGVDSMKSTFLKV